jgi:hypothetical protein
MPCVMQGIFFISKNAACMGRIGPGWQPGAICASYVPISGIWNIGSVFRGPSSRFVYFYRL